MQPKAATVDQYIGELPEDRKKAVAELRKVIKKNIKARVDVGHPTTGVVSIAPRFLTCYTFAYS